MSAILNSLHAHNFLIFQPILMTFVISWFIELFLINILIVRVAVPLKDYYKYTFFPQTIIHWNALSHHIPILPTLAQFSTAVCQVVHSVP